MSVAGAGGMGDPRHAHMRGASVATLALTLLLVVFPVPQSVQLVVLVSVVAVLGVPHGALDHLAGAHLFRPHLGASWLPIFLAAYVAVCGLVIAFWIRFPLAGLLGFLAVAVIHFGSEDTEDSAPPSARRAADDSSTSVARTMEIVARGGLPIIAPCAAHPEEVGRIFDLLGLLGTSPGGETLARMIGASWPVLLLALAPAAGAAARDALRRGSWQPLHRFVEIPVLAAALVMLPTLVGFVVYFVGWHSVRHTLTWVVRLEPSNPKRGFMRFARLALPLTAATAMLGALAWLLLPGAIDERALQVVFVGLAALTIPHVLLEVLVESFS